MPISRSMLLAVAAILWLLLALILGWTGVRMLRACGVSLFGYQLSWCGETSASSKGLNRQHGLIVELAGLQHQYRALPACGPGEQPNGNSSIKTAPVPPIVAPGKDPAVENGGKGGPAMPPAPGQGTPADIGSGGRPNNVNPDNQGTLSPPLPAPGEASGSNGQDSNQAEGRGTGSDNEPGDELADTGGGLCQPGQRPNGGPLILALDHSKSMALPIEMDDRLATELEAKMEENTAAGRRARDLYNSYVDQPGTKRLDVLKQAILRSVGEMQLSDTVGLVTFAGCQGVVDEGLFEADARAELLSRVQSMKPVPATPVSDALQAALGRARVTGGRIVLVTDGRDTCSGDPCAVARRSNGVRVDVLAIGGGRALSCIAEATGGQLIEASAAEGIFDHLHSLLSQDGGSCR